MKILFNLAATLVFFFFFGVALQAQSTASCSAAAKKVCEKICKSDAKASAATATTSFTSSLLGVASSGCKKTAAKTVAQKTDCCKPFPPDCCKTACLKTKGTSTKVASLVTDQPKSPTTRE